MPGTLPMNERAYFSSQLNVLGGRGGLREGCVGCGPSTW